MNRIFCFAKQTKEQICLYLYIIDLEQKNIFKKLVDQYIKKDYHRSYKIIKEIVLVFPFNANLTATTLKNYGMVLFEKLKENEVEESPIDIVFDLESTFTSQISLPKLTGKALNDSYKSEIERQFGKYIDEFIVHKQRIVNENKGYTFKLTMVNEDNYRVLLEIFNSVRLKVASSIYLPSIIANTIQDNESKNAGIIMDNEQSFIFITHKGILEDYRIVDSGYDDINKEICLKFDVASDEVEKYRQENMGKPALKRVVYHVVKDIISKLYILLMDNTNDRSNDRLKELNKTYLYSTDGKIKDILMGFPLSLRKKFDTINLDSLYRYQIFISAFYDNSKNFISFPIKVRYEKK